MERVTHPTYNAADIRTVTVTPLKYPPVPVTKRVLLLPDGTYGDIPPDDEPSYDVRHVQRWERGTSYPKIVDDVVTMMLAAPLHGRCPLVVDGTGVGRGIVDSITAHKRWNFPITPVVITGGATVSHAGGYVHVPKVDLVACVQMLLQNKRLRFPNASKIPEVATLISELGTFQSKTNIATGHESFAAWRERDHDDLVLALALVLWQGESGQFRVRFLD